MIDYEKIGQEIGGRFLKFKDTNPIEGEFVGIEVEDNPFKKKPTDPEKRLKYTFLINGQEKSIGSPSRRLWTAFKKAGVKEGDMVRVTRHGLAFETDFEVEVLP